MGEPKKCKMGEPTQCSTIANELSDDLKEEIFAWVPVKSLGRFRAVSKHWNALLSSTKFITTKWAEAPPNREPWLVIYGEKYSSTNCTCLAYSFYTQGWQENSCASISFMQERYPSFLYSYNFLGYAAGLFLHQLFDISLFDYNMSIAEDNDLSFDMSTVFEYTVCNPVTRSFTRLPRKLSIGTTFAEGIVEGEGDSRGTYKVVMVSDGEKKNIVEIYDSSEKSWSIAGHLLQDVILKNREMVFCDGCFYCNAVRSGDMEDLGITGFSLREGAGIFALLPKIANGKHMVHRELLACGLRLLVAASIANEGETLLEEVIIWEFEKQKLDGSSSSSSVDSSSSLWKEIAKMPPSMCNDLKRNSPRQEIKIVAVGDHVCFVGYHVMNVPDYKLNENSWTWLPSCPLDYHNYVVTAFEPRLNMEVGCPVKPGMHPF